MIGFFIGLVVGVFVTITSLALMAVASDEQQSKRQ